MNFAYVEQGQKKNALVKLRLCPGCSLKLNHHHKRKLWKKEKSKKALKKSKESKKHKKHSKSKHRHKHKHKRTSGEGTSRRYTSSEDESDDSSDSDVESRRESTSAQETPTSAEQLAGDIWSKPAEALVEKSKEEEFDDYFKDMLL